MFCRSASGAWTSLLTPSVPCAYGSSGQLGGTAGLQVVVQQNDCSGGGGHMLKQTLLELATGYIKCVLQPRVEILDFRIDGF